MTYYVAGAAPVGSPQKGVMHDVGPLRVRNLMPSGMPAPIVQVNCLMTGSRTTAIVHELVTTDSPHPTVIAQPGAGTVLFCAAHTMPELHTGGPEMAQA